MSEYIRVAEDEQVPEEAIELPSDEDGTILLQTIQGQFPGGTGLRYRNEETQTWRGVRLADGMLYPPAQGWGNALYIVVSSKTDSSSKRKFEESPTAREPNPKIMRNYTMETDDAYLGDLIVLGLSWKAKDDDIKEYFSRYGELDYHEVKKSPTTGQSRGFGFIRFKDSEVAKDVMSRSHTIMERRVDIRLSKGKDDAPRKIFIGRLPSNCSATDIRAYFEKYGAISDVYVPQPYRQFGFVTFASGEVARDVIGRSHMLNGARVNVTAAEPKSNKGHHSSSPSSSPRNNSRGYGYNTGYGNYPDRNNGGALANQMMYLAAMSSMAQGMGGMPGGMGNMAGGMGNMGGGGMAGMNGGMGAAGMASMSGGMGTGMNMATMGQSGGGMGSHGMSTNMSSMGSNVSGVGGMNTSAMESGMSNNQMQSNQMQSAVNSDANYALWNRESSRS